MDKREALFQKLNTVVIVLFALAHLAIGAVNIWMGRPYYYCIAFASLLFLAVPPLGFKLLRVKMNYQLSIAVYLFFFAAFTVGTTLNVYHIWIGYDKLTHTLSGILFGFLALVLFYVLKPKKEIEKGDCPLLCVFITGVSMAVAVFWEIGEYIVSKVSPLDPQNVLTTGVGDTMLDMTVALCGTLLFLIPVIVYFVTGKRDFFMGAFETFFRQNFAGKDTPAERP